MSYKSFTGALLVALALSSCDDTTDSIGTFITGQSDQLQVSAQSFNLLPGESVKADSILSRSTKAYLGCMIDSETGSRVTADFVTQFNLLENYQFPAKEKIESRMDGEIVADSCEIQLFCDQLAGDSLATMKMMVYEMSSPIEEGVNYYSNYDPFADGKVRSDGIKVGQIYAMANKTDNGGKRKVTVKLNQPYTDKSGVTYNNYGTYILRTYYNHPEYFKNSYSFIHRVVPGFMVQHVGGVGSMAQIGSTLLNVSFKYKENDSIINGNLSFAGTEEVLQTTRIQNDREAIQHMLSDNSCTYINSPAGIFTRLTLPVDEIYLNHETDSINSAKLILPRINHQSQNSNNWNIPQVLLMVSSDSLSSFFERGKIADAKYTYLAPYAATNSVNADANTYTFNNISSLIAFLHRKKTDGLRQDPAWVEKHPDWNKVTLVPVTANYKTSSGTNKLYQVVHDMTLSTTRLMRDNLQIHLIYSKFQ